MSKRGFTLIELLAVIVILAVILIIAIPQVLKAVDNSRKSAYIKNEQMVVNVAQTYLASNSGKAPVNEGHITVVSLSQLQENNLIGDIKDVRDKQTICTGYILIINIGSNEYDYQAYLNCGENYQTEGYTTENLQEVDVLVVAGGGGGSGSISGGGGAGGLIFEEAYNINFINSVSVGAGGSRVENLQPGNNGENSMFGSLVAFGGGRGATGGSAGNFPAESGGSGGGGQRYASPNNPNGANAVAGQGHNGGSILVESRGYAGGGGAGGEGHPEQSNNSGGDGGIGLYFGEIFSNIYGDEGWFAGGGGGSSNDFSTVGKGGKGGGGTGGRSGEAENGMPNTGGGGGGGYLYASGQGGSGGSGIVLIRYPGHQRANGGIVSTYNGYTIHAFTEVGESIFEVLEL